MATIADNGATNPLRPDRGPDQERSGPVAQARTFEDHLAFDPGRGDADVA
ncbi:MAG: hypothetical protein GY925_07095 [Actinomycetia bacterium]|nr:hypothetical protein [Actinomycetes bacterium]